MSFTYTPFESDKDRVRFHIGDTDASAPRFDDETIIALITEYSTWQRAALACIMSVMAALSVPDFTADWLRVDSSKARAGYELLLRLKQREWGINLRGLSVSSVHVYRLDSRQSDEPTYDDLHVRDGVFGDDE